MTKCNNIYNYLSYWHNKPDCQCIELATKNNVLDAYQALLNIAERDFCTDLNNNLLKRLNNDNKKTISNRL